MKKPLALIVLLTLAGCTTTVMVNPETGETAQCKPAGNGFFDVQSCVDGYKALGWKVAN